MAEFAVKAETLTGSVMTLRRGFPSRAKAEDHPVTLSLWKRVWVERIAPEQQRQPPPPQPAVLPPLPWDWVASKTPSSNGGYNAYLVDATGRKIGAIWGKGAEKALIADFILRAVNGGVAQNEARDTTSSEAI